MSYLGEKIKKLGFGLMRLPQNEEVIDVEQVKEMVDLFLNAGYTYFDTAWLYDGSEEAIRQALVERYPRESYQLASKAAAWAGCKTKEETEDQLRVSLERTGAGYFDFYLLHNIGEAKTKYFNDYGSWEWIMDMKKKGLVKHVGFSFHASPEELEQILIEHPEMEFVQLQINYADWNDPTVKSRECYEIARKYGKPVIIMEPVKGGLLANPPGSVVDIFKAAEPDASAASWAIRFAADLEGVITVLSGMSNIEQMKDNLAVMNNFTGLTDEEKSVIKKAREELEAFPGVPCTVCNYCAKVCPNDIGISDCFGFLNMYLTYQDKQTASFLMGMILGQHEKNPAEQCVECGACEDACPQHINIRDELKRVVENLGEVKAPGN